MIEMTGGPNELTDRERDLLANLEEQISHAESQHYWANGKAYRAIRDARLYRAASNFEQYCRARWGRPRQNVNRYIAAVEVGEDLEARGMRAPMTKKQCSYLVRLDSDERVEVARRVEAEGGWRTVTAGRVKEIAEEVAPTEHKEVVPAPQRTDLVLVKRGSRVGPSTRAKGRIVRGLEAMAAEADAIQKLGPYAVEDALRAMTESESNAAREAVLRSVRLLERFLWAWKDERGDQPEDGQQSMLLAA